jgi:hypothetical protein
MSRRILLRLARGNIAKRAGVALDVNEAEAFREELLDYNRSGLTQAEQQQVAAEYAKALMRIADNPRYGDQYLRRILIDENFDLLPGQAFSGPQPDWTTGWSAH